MDELSLKADISILDLPFLQSMANATCIYFLRSFLKKNPNFTSLYTDIRSSTIFLLFCLFSRLICFWEKSRWHSHVVFVNLLLLIRIITIFYTCLKYISQSCTPALTNCLQKLKSKFWIFLLHFKVKNYTFILPIFLSEQSILLLMKSYFVIYQQLMNVPLPFWHPGACKPSWCLHECSPPAGVGRLVGELSSECTWRCLAVCDVSTFPILGGLDESETHSWL